MNRPMRGMHRSECETKPRTNNITQPCPLVAQRLSLEDTARLMFLVGNALNDAGVASWDAKRFFNFARPITMIQCGLAGEAVEAWLGPYLGVGVTDASVWQPYQATTFVTPAFAGYVSGHSTFSAAAYKALELFFGGIEYLAPKCHLIPEGTGLYERRIDAGMPGFVPGLTDIPNNGPRTQGGIESLGVQLGFLIACSGAHFLIALDKVYFPH